jgi:GTPase SAR1 family protein
MTETNFSLIFLKKNKKKNKKKKIELVIIGDGGVGKVIFFIC